MTPGARGAKLEFRERVCRKRVAIISHVNFKRDLETKSRLRVTVPHQVESPTPTRITGVVNNQQGPPGTSQTFHATSHWLGNVDGQWYAVYAGARANRETDHDTQSELRVYHEPTFNTNELPAFLGSYTPPGGGKTPLRIVSATGDLLKIEAIIGAHLLFDVGQRSFATG